MKTEEELSQQPEHAEDNLSPSEGDDDYEDDDTCTPVELEKLFKYKYNVHDEPKVTFDNSYVLKLAKDDSFTCIAAGISDGSVRLFQINSERGLHIEPPPTNKTLSICGIRFLDETPNLLMVGTTNGLVRLLDLRTRTEVMRFENMHANESKPRDILSFDRSSNSRLVCMGAEQWDCTVDLSFYDLRTSNHLFRYIESHQDSVTTLRFHPQHSNLLCSGSIDGLINIFNVQAIDEDNAIMTTINTESSVHKVNWHKNANNQNIVSCITQTNSFASYEFDGDVIAKFDRRKITEAIKRKNKSNCNLVDCHSMNDNSLMLLTGTNLNNGTILRSCKIQNGQLFPYANFEGNSQIVRESIFDDRTNILITGGEKGVVTLWTPLPWEKLESNTSSSTSSSIKMKTKRSKKVTPY